MKLSTHLICASGEQPTDDRPTRNDVRAEEFVGRVDDSDYEPNKIAAKRLRLWCWKVLPLEPVLISFVSTEPDLYEMTKTVKSNVNLMPYWKSESVYFGFSFRCYSSNEKIHEFDKNGTAEAPK
jgi:hypothetical protein